MFMNVPYIKKLIAEGEHQQLDFKFEISDARKIAKTFVAFANTDGGTLLIGVKDNGNIAGVRSDEEYYMVNATASMYCKPKVNFTVKKWTVEGKSVLEVIIPKSEDAPHLAEVEPKKWMAYVRVKDENILANTVQLKVWKKLNHKRGVFIEFSEKEKMLLKYLEEHPYISVSKFCKIALIPRHTAENILADLITLDLVEQYFDHGLFLYRQKEKTPEPSRLAGHM